MPRTWSKTETLIGLFVAGIGAVIMFVAGLWIYVSATTKPLHPTAQDVQTASHADPSAKWAGAVEQVKPILRAAVFEQNLPGLSVAVGMGGELVWAEGFGWADIDTKSPVTPKTTFRIGTASIALTSAAAGLLIERNRLNLDEKIQTYAPEFPDKPWPITLRQVMAHTSGLTSDGGDEGPLFGVHCDRPLDALRLISGRDLPFQPGTDYRYSRFGYILVSAAIEQAADQAFLSFMQKEIFDPLQMNDTVADLATEASPDRATSYFPRFAGDPRYGPDPMRPLDLSCYSGSSIFLSTASDLVRFALAVNSGTLLQPSTVSMLQAPQRTSSGQDTGYGLGWDIDNATLSGQPSLTIGHDGDLLGGIVSSVMTFPSQGIVVAVVSNTSYADTPGLAQTIAAAFASQQR